MRTNYLLATWSGKRRNPSKDYLRAQIEQLQKLNHRLDRLTVIRPLGSNDRDYYAIDFDKLSLDKPGIKCQHGTLDLVCLSRPTNDRAYGQFLYAYQTYPDFDYYFIVEDDYLPNLDNFDGELIYLLEQLDADYLCGSFGPVPGGKVAVPRHNIGVIKGEALARIIKTTPNWKFSPNGENDGQEQEVFSELCKRAGVVIKDYSNHFSVPYYDRYLRYFSRTRDHATPFVPYQLLHHKAFGYHGEEGDENSHFLSTIEFINTPDPHGFVVLDYGERVGYFTMLQSADYVEVTLFLPTIPFRDYTQTVKERIEYECRGRKVIFQ